MSPFNLWHLNLINVQSFNFSSVLVFVFWRLWYSIVKHVHWMIFVTSAAVDQGLNTCD